MPKPNRIDPALVQDPKVLRRFFSKVAKSAGCWEWTGTRGKLKPGSTHGQLGIGGRLEKAHRVSWEIHRGPIPDGAFVLHLCANPPCVRPEHLYLGTQADNMRDMVLDGNSTRGERNARSKLTESEVREIRSRAAHGEDQASIAGAMGVCPSSISLIVRRKRWAHVTP